MTRPTVIALALVGWCPSGCGPMGSIGGKDTEGPTITMDSPDPSGYATRTTEGLLVTGTVSDNRSGVERVTVNGIDIGDPATGQFQHLITPALGINVIEIFAKDLAGNATGLRRTYIYGDLADPEQHPTHIYASLHAGGFPRVSEVAERWAEELVAADPDFAETTISGNDLPMCDSVAIESVTFQGIDLELRPDAGQIQIHGIIDSNPDTRIEVAFRARDCTIFKVDIPGNVSADEGIFSGGLALDLVDGQFEAGIHQPVVTLPGYDVDLDTDLLGTLGEIAQWLTTGAVEKAIEDAAVDAAGSGLENQLNALLGEHELLTLPEDRGVLVLSIEAPTMVGPSLSSDGITLPLATRLEARILDADGNTIPAPKVHEGKRTLWTPEPAYVPMTDWHFQGGLSYNLLNAALYSVWQTGLLDQTIPLGDLVELLPARVRELEEVSIVLIPRLPPVVVPTPEGQGAEPAQLQIGDMRLQIRGARPGEQELETLAVLSLNATAGVELHAIHDIETTSLGLTMDEPDLLVEVVEATDEEVADAFDQTLEDLGPSLIPLLVAQKAKFALPSPGNTPLRLDEIKALDDRGLLQVVGRLGESGP